MEKQMEAHDVLDRIRQEQRSYSASHKLVASYVLDNYVQIPFMSITALSRSIGVSDSTVVKFCNRLGYEKFAEFKSAISEIVRAGLSLSAKPAADGPDDDVLLKELAEDTSAIEATLKNPINRESLKRLIPQVNNAKHVYVMGGRSSSYYAGLFAAMLRYLNLKVFEINSGDGEYIDRISMIDRDDIVFAISLPRYATQVINALKILHEKGVFVVLLTDTGLCPAYPYADIPFHCSVTSSYYFPCVVGCISLISVICRAISNSRKNDAEHIEKLKETLLREKIYQ